MFVHWARDLEEPLERLALHLRQIEKVEADERRAVPAVERAKAEIRETQKFAYRLLEGLFGLAGSADFVQRLRVRTSGSSEPAEPA